MTSLLLTYVLMASIAVVCMMPIFGALRARRVDLFKPIYSATAYFFLLFFLRPAYDLVLGSEFLGSAPFGLNTACAFNYGLLYSLLGFCAFLVGYYAKLGPRLANKLPQLPSSWNRRRLRVVRPIMVAVGGISYFMLVTYQGGWVHYIWHKQETLTAPGQGYLLLGISLISIAYTMSLTHSLDTRKRGYRVYIFWLPILLGIGFFSGSKGAFLLPVLIAIISSHYLKRGIRLKHILGMVLVVSLLFPIFNTYRNDSPSSPARDQISLDMYIRQVMGRFYGIDSMTLIVRDTPKVMDFQYGKTIAPFFVAWIPRQLWEDKPTISFGKKFAETYLGRFFAGTGTSASPTILGEAYLNWYVPGLLLIALLSGVAIRAAYAWLIQKNFGAPAVFLYSQLFLYLFTFWEASIAGLLAQFLASLILLLIIVFSVGRRCTKPVKLAWVAK